MSKALLTPVRKSRAERNATATKQRTVTKQQALVRELSKPKLASKPPVPKMTEKKKQPKQPNQTKATKSLSVSMPKTPKKAAGPMQPVEDSDVIHEQIARSQTTLNFNRPSSRNRPVFSNYESAGPRSHNSSISRSPSVRMTYQNVHISGALQEIARKLNTSCSTSGIMSKSQMADLLKTPTGKRVYEEKRSQKAHYTQDKIRSQMCLLQHELRQMAESCAKKDDHYSAGKFSSSQVKQKEEKLMNKLTNAYSQLGCLPGSSSTRPQTPERKFQPSKAGIQKVNEFRYKTNFCVADQSGTSMFQSKDSTLFGMQTPTLFTRSTYHAQSKNKSSETMFALNQELGRRVTEVRQVDGKTLETSAATGKSHRIPNGVTL